MTSNYSKILFTSIFIALMFTVSDSAFALTATVNTGLTSVTTILKGVGLLAITLAFTYSGYQVAFAGKTFMQIAPVFFGGALIGGAATVAGFVGLA